MIPFLLRLLQCFPNTFWTAVLIALALGMGSKMELMTNYSNVPVMWMVLVGVSSWKSNPMDFCLSYFKNHDSESIKRYEEQSAE